MERNIKIKNISKSFSKFNNIRISSKKNTVLNNINLTLSLGDVFFLIGPNGSGKTTFLKLIAGLLTSDQGEINYFGNKNVKKINLGLSNSNFRSFYWRLSVRQNLEFFSKLNNLDVSFFKNKIYHLLKALDLLHLIDRPFMNLSSGQMQSISIIRALLTNPDILLLDEPTAHLDPINSSKVINFFKKYFCENKLVVIWCSHDLDEIDKIATRIGYLSNGQIFQREIEKFNNPENYIFEIPNSQNLKEILSNFKFEIVEERVESIFIRFLEKNFTELFQKFVQFKMDIQSIEKFSKDKFLFNIIDRN